MNFLSLSKAMPSIYKYRPFRIKSNKCISKKVPDSNNTNGKYFGNVEVHFEFAYQKPKYQSVDTKSDKGNDKKFCELNHYLGVVALVSPYTIQKVVGCGC